jgi:hypothetical protein
LSVTRTKRISATAVLAVAGLTFFAPAAIAHEEHHIGQYHVVVGFGTEPAYADEVNSVQLILSDHDEEPVTDLGEGLSVEVSFGDQTKDLGRLEPNFEVGEFGTPGDYRAWFIPTRSGPYTFHFTGKIGSTDIDEEFTSGPKTFSEIEDPGTIQFPVQDPTNAELAERIDREIPRVTTAAASAADDASGARTFGIAGIALGAAGLAVALASRRRRQAT